MCSALISSTTAATRRWGAPGATSTSLRWDARRNGRTRRRATPRLRRTSGGSGTTNQTRRMKIDPASCNFAPPGPPLKAATPSEELRKSNERNRMKLAEMEMNREVVSEAEWLVARKDLLTREKEFNHQRDALSKARRSLPWVKIDKEYVFDGPDGKETLADLFDGRSQLIVYHFMFGPDWEEGCKSCSYLADHFDGAIVHLVHRDVSFAVVSRAPLPNIEAFKKRMGWRFKWVSSYGKEFNFDYHVSFTKDGEAKAKVYYNYEMGEFFSDELPGLSVF